METSNVQAWKAFNKPPQLPSHQPSSKSWITFTFFSWTSKGQWPVKRIKEITRMCFKNVSKTHKVHEKWQNKRLIQASFFTSHIKRPSKTFSLAFSCLSSQSGISGSKTTPSATSSSLSGSFNASVPDFASYRVMLLHREKVTSVWQWEC